MLRLSDFEYLLPKELIAQYPLRGRDNCRLLVVDRKNNKIEHKVFSDIPGYLLPQDVLVLNDTKVMPCRIRAKRKTGGKAEIFLLGRIKGRVFKALLKPGRLKIGEKIKLGSGKITAEVISKSEVAFNTSDLKKIYALGAMPLPPYIKREATKADNIDYQTVYAAKEGAVASPTAGLHFTKTLLNKIKNAGIDPVYLTLHVGLGTFKPVKADDITKHKMEPERFSIPAGTLKAIKAAKKSKARVIAVGTTSLRALESYAAGAKSGQTDLFIYPGFKFKIADSLLTNFHLPRTTLFMLTCAFGGEKLIKKAYQEAVEKKYRFYSYGDAMLII
ncbi:MAG: tRNA preQ1(34) S-adenosylmethionine ribosyltransferase-isomerase QueA [Candidatus Omnitrophica bacterium]|nr:tRNA preQ1(34) S-adenosylmethionine ribosyltransferase-isomerase QueA [Candidatus Omnitrophota bacterium]